ncbi:hypothetical protein [Ferriphaselus sp. R-1]|uniref:hypothetical protein n=1 Tax=Ferriphaselus sp. R-1 TaxID=1485544 RepID=UPI00054D8EEC|nr:hypothetical protein [Ferriphaselus sp. R-1]
MIELITLTILVTVVIALIRPGRTPPLDNPLVIERGGQFHSTLAPQLNLAQPLIEAIARRLLDDGLPPGDSETLCFEIRDAEVAAHGQKFYLLGLTRRNGMLYFQAIGPRPLVPDTDRDTPYKVLQDYAAQVLVNIPATPGDAELGVQLVQTVLAVAASRGISARQLSV